MADLTGRALDVAVAERVMWRFRRYRLNFNWQSRCLMAQGAVVRAVTEEEAIKKTHALFPENIYGKSEFELINATPEQQSRAALAAVEEQNA